GNFDCRLDRVITKNLNIIRREAAVYLGSPLAAYRLINSGDTNGRRQTSWDVIVNAVSSKTGGGLNDLVQTGPVLRSALERAGISTHFFVGKEGLEALAAAGVDLHGMTQVEAGTPVRRLAWELVALPRFVRRVRASVVFQFSNFVVRPLRGVCQIVVFRSRTPFSEVYRMLPQRGAYQAVRYRVGRWASRLTLRSADVIFCLSETQRHEIAASMDTLGDAVRVVYPGLNVPEHWRGANQRTPCTIDSAWPADMPAGKTIVL